MTSLVTKTCTYVSSLDTLNHVVVPKGNVVMSDFSKLTVFDLEILSSLPKMTSIRSFAQNLDMTPSFLSKKIKKLEEALDQKLIQREASGVSMNPEAKPLVYLAREIMEKCQQLEAKDKNRGKEKIVPTLTLGTRGFLNTAFAGKLLEHFEAQNIPLEFRFIDMSPNDKQQAARANSVDMILGLKKMNYGESWITTKVGSIIWSVFAKKSHPLTKKNLVKWDQVLVYPFTKPMYWDGTSIVSIQDSLPFKDLPVRYGHGVQNTESAMAVISSTTHLTYIPRLVGKANSEITELKIQGLEQKKDDLYLSIHQDRVRNVVFQEVKNLVSQALGDA